MLNASTLKNCISMSHYLKRQEALIPAAPRSLLRDTGVGGGIIQHLHREEISTQYMKHNLFGEEKNQKCKRANLI